MGLRNALATNVTPLMLRLGLGAIFLWAGTAKLFYSNTAVGEEAALLANLGVIAAPSPPTTPPPAPAPVESQTPAPAQPAPAEEAPKPAPAEEAPAPETEPKAPPSVPPAMVALTTLAQAGAAAAPAPAFTADQFPDPVTYKRLHGITTLLHQSAQPDANGHRLWPAELSSPRMLRLFAWMAALTEFFGAVLVLIGFLTRLSALAMAGTMVVAMLLTTVGPAAIGPDAFLGLLPQPQLADPKGNPVWQTMMTQWIVLMSAIGLLCAGAGAFSIDRLVFGGSRTAANRARDEDDFD